ncbi:hypothetical protein [Novosphingobium aquimarinum]|uniref:hypothetical protein n=1 Tax=Novosphingobium aquimarinum TaxID=2682494 RepID=UPI0012EBD8FC|nr:hypothetical protein [Novosphingobium aquimarinum]
MASNAAQVDGVWDQPAQANNAHGYMQADLKFRSPAARKRQPVLTPVTLDVLGVEITWTPDGREFPPMILAAIERLYTIQGLEGGWDSYGGQTLDKTIVAPVLKFLLLSHHRGSPCPRLTPLSSGGIGLRWETPEKEIDLDIQPGGTFEFTVEDVASGEIHEYPVNTPEEAELIFEASL